MREIIGQSGYIEVICGCMFSGKTEELIRRMKRADIARQKLQLFKPKIDDRYSKEYVTSHDDSRLRSLPISDPYEILSRLGDSTRVVGIDEAQFFDDSIIEVVERLANRGLRVIIAGLELDYRGKPFGPMPQLLAIAEHVTKLTAVCMVCGSPATRTERTSGMGNQVLVGAKDHYEARCRNHHTSPEEAKQREIHREQSPELPLQQG